MDASVLEDQLQNSLAEIEKIQKRLQHERQNFEETDRRAVTTFRDLCASNKRVQAAQEDEWKSQFFEVINQKKGTEAQLEKEKETKNLIEVEKNRLKEELKHSQEKLKQKAGEMDGKISNFTVEKERQVKRMEKREKQLLERVQELEEAESHLAQEKKILEQKSTEKEKQLIWQLEDLKSQNSNVLVENKKLQNNQKQLEEEIHQRTEKLSKDLRSVNAEKENQGKKMEWKERELQQKLEDARCKNSNILAENRKLEKAFADLEQKMKEKSEKMVAELNEVIVGKENHERKMERREKELLEKIEDMKTENAKIFSGKQKLENDLAQMEERMNQQEDEMEKEMEKLLKEKERQEKQMERRYRQLQQRVQELTEAEEQSTNSRQHQEKQASEREEDLMRQMDLLMSELNQKKKEEDKLIKSCTLKDHQLDEQERKLNEQASTINLLQDRVKVLDSQISETISGKHNQLYQERKQMQKDEDEKISELLQEKIQLETHVSRVECELQQSTLKNKTLDKEVTILKQQISETKQGLHAEQQIVEEKLQQVITHHRTLSTEKNKINEEKDRYERELSDATARWERQLQLKERMIKELEEKEQELETKLEEEKHSKDTNMTAIKTHLQHAKKRLHDTEAEMERYKTLEQQAEEKVIELDKLMKDKESRFQEDVDNLKRENKRLKQQAENASGTTGEVAAYKLELQETREKLEDSEAFIQQLEESQKRIQQQLHEMKENNGIQEGQLLEEIKGLRDKVRKLTTDLEDARDDTSREVASLKYQLKEASRCCQEAEMKVKQLEDLEQRMRKQNDGFRQRKTSEKQEQNKEMDLLREKNNSINEELEKVKEETSAELVSLRAQLKDASRNLRDSQIMVGQLQEAETRLKKHLEEMRGKKVTLEREQQQEIEELRVQHTTDMAECKIEMRKVKRQVNDLEAELESERRLDEKTKKRLKNIEDEHQEDKKRLMAQIQQLKDENTKLQSHVVTTSGTCKMSELEKIELQGSRRTKVRLESEVEELKGSERSIRKQLEEISITKLHLESKVQELEGEKAMLENMLKLNDGKKLDPEVTVLTAKNQRLTKEVTENAKIIAELKESEQQLKKQKVQADMERTKREESLRKEIQDVKTENTCLINKLKGSSKSDAVEMKLTNSKLQTANSQLNDARIRMKEMEQKEKTLLEELRETKHVAESLRKDHNIDLKNQQISTLKQELEDLRAENTRLNSLKSTLQTKAHDYKKVEDAKNDIKAQNEDLQEDLQRVSEEREQAVQLLEEEREVIKSQEETIGGLKSAYAMLEEQVTDLETLTERLEANLQDAQSSKDSTTKALERQLAEVKITLDMVKKDKEAKCSELTEAEKKITDLQNQKSEAEKMNCDLKEEYECKEAMMIERIEECEKHTEHYKDQAKQLARQLGDLQTERANLELDLRALKEKFAEEQKDYDVLSDQLSGIVSKLENTKLTNQKLTTYLEKAIEQGEGLKDEKVNLETEVDCMQSDHAIERMKLQGMMSQQIKLIDFLHSKVDVPPKKRKKGLFGKSPKSKMAKENVVLPLQYKEMQEMLKKEMAKNAMLEQDLHLTHAELRVNKSASLGSLASFSASNLSINSNISGSASVTSDATTVLSAIVLSPSNQPSPTSLPLPPSGPFNRKKQKKVSQNVRASKRVKERMKHNIPHRFTNIMNMKPVKCAVCAASVYFGRHASKCQECHLVCHPKCAFALPHTCGLPFQFVRHFSESLSSQSESPSSVVNTSNNSSVSPRNLQSWMKVPGNSKQGWDKKWVVLTDSTLYIYNREHLSEKSRPWKQFNLQPAEGNVTIQAGLSVSELPNTVASDVPFVFRLENHTTNSCWPEDNTLYLMALTFAEKQRWVGTIENVVALSGFGQSEVKHQNAKMVGNTLLSLEEENKIDINCTIVLQDEVLLLGCDEGLYTMDLNKLTQPLHHLGGVGSIFQLHPVPQLGITLLIAGELRKLGFVDTNHLKAMANKSSTEDVYIKCTAVAAIESCHLFSFGEIDGAYHLCAAEPQKISILRYNEEKKNFVVRKEIPTAEPCSCLLFSRTGFLLAGMDRFYKVDLKTFETDEFLDSTDNSLVHAICGVAQLNSFPVAALQVAPEGEPEEFLLCYHEFALFVDGQGHRTRQEDLMWSRLPLALAYREPYLFITHFNCIEVLEIKPFSQCDRKAAHTFLELFNPRFVGTAITQGAVYVTSNQSNKVELLCLKGNLSDSMLNDESQDYEGSNAEDDDDTPKANGSNFSRVTRSSLKRRLDDNSTSDLSSSKVSRSSSSMSEWSAWSRTSFREAMKPNTIATPSSSSEEDPSCGITRFSRRTKGGKK